MQEPRQVNYSALGNAREEEEGEGQLSMKGDEQSSLMKITESADSTMPARHNPETRSSRLRRRLARQVEANNALRRFANQDAKRYDCGNFRGNFADGDDVISG
jgi:hypothetical protein